jgi:predicted AlkP superfamily phosphohydrolase/phosphomutase
MTAQPKVIAIVLESAEPSLVELWCNEGKLPTLDRLRRSGVWMRLDCPSYISSGSTWPSMNIGTNPAKHGIGFFHREIKSGTYRTIKKYVDQVHGEPFWHFLGRAGVRNCIFDLAVSLPFEDVNGTIIVDWGSEHPAWKPSSFPERKFSELVSRFGKHPLSSWYQHQPESKQECKAVADKLLHAVDLRTRIIEYLLENDQFDFALCNYAEPHWAGHIFWHLHDASHPQHDPAARAYCGDVMFNSYSACDQAIGKLISKHEHANILIMSNIGMGSHAGGDMMVQQILDRLGMSSRPSNAVETKPGRRNLLFGEPGSQIAFQRIERLVGWNNISRIKRWVPTRLWDNWTRRILSQGSNWAKSRAFQLPGDNSTLIRINLKGREPNGLVDPGQEYESVCEELALAFSELIEPITGKPAVDRVVKLREELDGDQLDQLPDIAVVWNNFSRPIEALSSERIGRVELKEFNKRTGGHWHQGFLLASGPAFGQGVTLEKADLVDIAPTILHMFGTPLPRHMDGKVIYAALREHDDSGA